MRSYLFLSILIFQFVNAFAQTPQYSWIKKLQGPNDDHSINLTVDSDENIYIIGRYNDSIESGTKKVLSNGDRDVFISKYNKDGQLIWLKSFGDYGYDKGMAISTDLQGNIYITGRYFDSCLFGNKLLRSKGHYDIFLAKMDSSGNYIWVKSAGGRLHDEGLALYVDVSGNPYITGFFRDTAFFDSKMVKSDYDDNFDIFLAKYNTIGQVQWVKSAGGSNDDHGWTITGNNLGDIFIGGHFIDSAKFDGNPVFSIGSMDAFVASYNINGDFNWVKTGGSLWDDVVLDMVVDQQGNLYTIGFFDRSAKFDETTLLGDGFNEVFINCYERTGDMKWAKSAGGENMDEGEGIALYNDKELIICGGFQGDAKFGNNQVTSQGDYDVFISSLDLNGNFNWAKSVGSATNDYAFAVKTYGNNLYVTGYYSDHSSFDQIILNSKGKADAFLAKLNLNNIGFEEVILEQSFYPNPSKGLITIDGIDAGILNIYDIQGKLLRSENFRSQHNQINLTNFNNGIYLLHFIVDGKISIEKLIISK